MVNKRLKLAILVLFLFTLISFVSAVDYYVSTTGNDLNNGMTLANAFRNVQRGVNSLAAGDILYIAQGTYAENVVRTNLIGTALNPILITSVPGQKAIIDGNFVNPALRLDGAFFRIENLVFANGTRSSWPRGTVIIDYSDNVIIRNVEIYGTVAPCNGESGQLYFETSNNILVENSVIHDSVFSGGDRNCGGIALDGADYVTGSRNITIRNNTIYNMPIGTGIWDKHPAEGTIETSYNTVYNVDTGILIRNRNYYAHHNLIYNVTEYGILMWDENTGYFRLENPRIEYNTIANCGESAIRYTAGKNSTMSKNIYYECSNKILSDVPRTLTVCWYGWRCNDPLYQPDFANITKIKSNDNCIYYTPSTLPFLRYDLSNIQYNHYSLVQAQSLFGLETNSIFANPSFISSSPLSPDFLRPSSSSACANMGYYGGQTQSQQNSPDVNSDGLINVKDLSIIIFNQGRIPTGNYGHLDLNNDTRLDWSDVQIVINNI
jgi:hypothetical protein